MGLLTVLLLVFPLLLLGLMLLSIWAMNRAADRMVGARHRDIQTIVETGQVPERWLRPRKRWHVARVPSSARAASPEGLPPQAAACCLARLDALIDYVHSSTLVADESVRAELLARLQTVRTSWHGGDQAS